MASCKGILRRRIRPEKQSSSTPHQLGETFSQKRNIVGALSLLARACSHRAAHIESGLRSFNLLHPFPEEIIRILTFNLSNIYFAPSEWALSNMQKYRGEEECYYLGKPCIIMRSANERPEEIGKRF